MKKRFSVAIAGMVAAISVLFVSSCDDYLFPCIYGNGVLETESRSMPVFNTISLTNSFNVIIVQDSVYKVVVEAEETIVPYVLTGIIGNNLVIKNRDNYCLRETLPVVIYVHTPKVSKLLLSGSGYMSSDSISTDEFTAVITGSGNIEIEKIYSENTDAVVSGSGYIKMDYLETETVDAKISGSGMIKMKGKAFESDLTISGSGDIRNSDLEHQYADVRITGSGSAWVYATKSLNATITGSGNVYYKGSPEIYVNISGSGRVIKM